MAGMVDQGLGLLCASAALFDAGGEQPVFLAEALAVRVWRAAKSNFSRKGAKAQRKFKTECT
jgi:hypothetical protein